jgi:hypothetical protein
MSFLCSGTVLQRWSVTSTILLISAVSAAAHTPSARDCAVEPIATTMNDDEILRCNIDFAGDFDDFRFVGTAGTNLAIQVTRTGGAVYPCWEQLRISPKPKTARSPLVRYVHLENLRLRER